LFQKDYSAFRDFLGFNSHCRTLEANVYFLRQDQHNVCGRGVFRVAPPLELKNVQALFQYKVFRMLLAKGKVTQEMIAMLKKWRHFVGT
jgi:hypothetical protein